MPPPPSILARARMLATRGDRAEAEKVLRAALESHSDALDLKLFLGELLHAQSRTEEAIDLFEAISEVDPESPATLNLFDIYSGECRWPAADRVLHRMRSKLVGSSDVALRPFRLMLGFDEPTLHLEASRRFALRHPSQVALPLRRPEPDGRIKVAYLSCNFNQHPMAACLSELIELHDRNRFQVFALDWSEEDGSAERARLKAAFDAFVDIRNLDDTEAARLLRSERIDIAVDLMGFTLASRPGVLMARPCPVQVNFLGYPGTIGAPWMDYLIGDPWVTPLDGSSHFSERIVQLPFCYLANDRKKRIAARRPARAEHGLPEHAFVFCCTNHPHKITDAMFGVWLRILQRVRGSVLWLWVEQAAAQANLRAVASSASIDPSRIVFAPRLPANEDHLARLSLADLFLDTVPYNAHTSASDAIWVGVPVLTVPGQSFHARVAASILAAAELPELICRDMAEYEAKAVRLATQPVELEDIRQYLKATRQRVPLFDTPRYVSGLEAAYSAMFDLACAGKPSAMLRIEQPAPPATAAAPLQVAERFNQCAIQMAEARRFPEAEALLRQSIAIHPEFAKAYNNLGNVLDEKRLPKEAEDAYLKAIALDPGYALAFSNLSALLRNAGRIKEAQEALTRSESLVRGGGK